MENCDEREGETFAALAMLPLGVVALLLVLRYKIPPEPPATKATVISQANVHCVFPCNQEKSPLNEHKLRRIEDVDIFTLADKIPVKWKAIGRLLGLEDSRVNQIEINNKGDVYEQCYEMLNAWKRNQPDSTAPCEQLKSALSHEIIMKKDLVASFCYTDD